MTRTITPWALGDYHRFAKATIWEIGEILVEACGIRAGQRVLDVATGTGNTALRAAQRGASVVASDVTPENFEAGRGEAARLGVTLEWVDADAQALPFEDATFDVVTSSFGAIFAPDHRAVVDELLRVCRRDGAIALTAFTPDGVSGAFFDLFGRYAPPPPDGAGAPTMWGDPDYVSRLFADRAQVETSRRSYIERAASPGSYRELFYETFGPIVALRTALAEDHARAEQFDRDFAEFTVQQNSGPPTGPAEYRYDYLLILARSPSP